MLNYNGSRYRNRAEAAWAVFLERAGVANEYLPAPVAIAPREDFSPSFRLKELGVWLQVIEGAADAAMQRRCGLLSSTTLEDVFLIEGLPGLSLSGLEADIEHLTYKCKVFFSTPRGKSGSEDPMELTDDDLLWSGCEDYVEQDDRIIYGSAAEKAWCECVECSTVGMVWRGSTAHLACRGCKAHGEDGMTAVATPRLVEAYRGAQAAAREIEGS